MTSGDLRIFIDNPTDRDLLGFESVARSVAHVLTTSREPTTEAGRPGTMSGFRGEFGDLVNDLGVERVVVLVDDLDRCLPSAVLASLEAIKLFLSVPKMAFVLAADQDMVREAIAAGLGEQHRSSVFARDYLDKIVQVPVTLPYPTLDDTEAYVALLLCEQADMDEGEFAELISYAVTRRAGGDAPYLGGQRPVEIPDEHLLLAERCVRGLSGVDAVNPRRVKRFMNAFAVRRHAVAELEISLQPDVLIKLLVLEHRFLELFKQIATSSTADRAALLAGLEEWAAGPPDVAAPDGLSADARPLLAADPHLSELELDAYFALARRLSNTRARLQSSQEVVRRVLLGAEPDAAVPSRIALFPQVSRGSAVRRVPARSVWGRSVPRRLDPLAISPLATFAATSAAHERHLTSAERTGVGGGTVSDGFDAKAFASGLSDLPDVIGVRGHHGVSASERTFDDRDIHDVVVSRATREGPDVSGLVLTQLLDIACSQRPRETCLTGAAAPRLGQDRRGNDRNDLLREEAGMKGPHPPVIALRRDQRAGVVGDPAHNYAERFCELRLAGARLSRARARASPSSSSASVSAPCSTSHSATARRPSSNRSRWAATSASHALKEVPSASAARSIASASLGGNEMERFDRCAMRDMVAQQVGQGCPCQGLDADDDGALRKASSSSSVSPSITISS